VWAKDWLQRRVLYGQYEKLIVELTEEDPRGYMNYMRISSELCQELLERVGPKLDKNDSTCMRKALHPGHRLAIALRYMASGDSYQSLSYSFRVDTVRLRMRYGCVQASTVIYGYRRFPTGTHGSLLKKLKFLNMLKITPRKKTRPRKYYGRSRKPKVISTVPSRMYYGYPRKRNGLQPWRFRRRNRESVTGALQC